jgi:hypothetical protein
MLKCEADGLKMKGKETHVNVVVDQTAVNDEKVRSTVW